MSMPALVNHTAVELAGLLAAGAVSAREVTAAHLERIAAVGPSVNAIVTITAEAAMRQARMLDDAFARSGPVGRCTDSPLPTKTLPRPVQCGPPTVRGSSPTTSPTSTRCTALGCAQPGRSAWVRRTLSSSVPVRRRSTISSG